MKQIKLSNTRGRELYTIVDDDVYELIKHKSVRLDNHGYAIIRFRRGKLRKEIRIHRLVMNPPKDMVIDHLNFNKLDNRRENLRIVTRSENSKRKPPKVIRTKI